MGLVFFFSLSPSPSCPLLLACLSHMFPRPPVGGCAGCVPVRRLRVWVRFACVASCSVPLSRSSLVRFASSSPSLLFFSLRVFPAACLCGGDVIPSGVFAHSRFSCLPVIRHPSDVIRPMWLIASPSGGGFHCPLFLLACRCYPLCAGCITIRFSPRLDVSGCGAVCGGGRLVRW